MTPPQEKINPNLLAHKLSPHCGIAKLAISETNVLLYLCGIKRSNTSLDFPLVLDLILELSVWSGSWREKAIPGKRKGIALKKNCGVPSYLGAYFFFQFAHSSSVTEMSKNPKYSGDPFFIPNLYLPFVHNTSTGIQTLSNS